jgi:hypothetical protein
MERRKRDQQAGGGKKGAAAGMAGAGAAAGMWDAPGSGAGKGGKKRPADAMEGDSASSSAAGAKKGKGPSGAAVPPATSEWDVSKMPGQELLSHQEKLLCSTLQLLPQHYLMIKERLIREWSVAAAERSRDEHVRVAMVLLTGCLLSCSSLRSFTRGFLKENSAKQLIKIDVNKTSKIFDFFVSVGWLNTGDQILKASQPAQTSAATTAAAAPRKPAGLPAGK